MGFAVDILQVVLHHVGVDLGGGDIRMPQHLLNGTEIRSVFQQMDGEGVAQGVGGDILLDAGGLLVVLDDLPEALAAHALSVHVDE